MSHKSYKYLFPKWVVSGVCLKEIQCLKQFRWTAGLAEQFVTFFLSYSSQSHSHFLKDIEKSVGKRFNVNQRTVRGKVQFKKIKFTKAERFRWRVQARPPTRRWKVQVAMELCSVRAAKMQERRCSGNRKCWSNDSFNFLRNFLNFTWESWILFCN